MRPTDTVGPGPGVDAFFAKDPADADLADLAAEFEQFLNDPQAAPP